MKKMIVFAVCLLMSGALFAQSSKAIFDSLIVPNAVVLVKTDASYSKDSEFLKHYMEGVKALYGDAAFLPATENLTKDNLKIVSFCKELGISMESFKQILVSVDERKEQIKGKAPFEQCIIAVELSKKLSPELIIAVLNKNDHFQKTSTQTLSVTERNGVPLLTITSKTDDDSDEWKTNVSGYF